MSEGLRMTVAGNDREFPFINGGIFRMTTKKWPDWYVKMNDDLWTGDVQGKQGYPGEQGEFKFTKSGDYYLISSKHWPEWYIYMKEKNGNVRGGKGDPGPKGHWRIKPRSDGTVLLSTEECSGSYMYMQNWPSGDVQGIEEPDEQAYFILSCDVRLKGGPDGGFNKIEVSSRNSSSGIPRELLY